MPSRGLYRGDRPDVGFEEPRNRPAVGSSPTALLMQAQPNNPMIEFLVRYSRRTAGEAGPELFVQEVLGATPSVQQRALLKAYGRGARRISFVSGHNVGKTAALAWTSLHALITEYPFVGLVTAPTEGQLFNGYFTEVRRWYRKLPSSLQDLFEVKSDAIVLKSAPENCFLQARTSRPEKPEALAGIHTHEGFLLLIADEASGVPEPIFEAASGSMAGHNAMTILTGNPVRTAGLFFDTWHTLADMWVGIHASSEDSELVTRDFIEDMRRRYGIDSNAYRVRVLGLFPQADDDSVIPFELVEAALTREVVANPMAPVSWGLDVARKGSNRTALASRQANVQIGKVKFWRDKNLMETAQLVKLEWDMTYPPSRPVEIMVDAIGMGAGVADRLVQLALPAVPINVSEASSVASHVTGGQFLNLRAELAFKGREWFSTLNVHINDEELARELSIPWYKFTKTGRIFVASKDEIARRHPIMGSPDLSDAFLLTFAGAASFAMYGSEGPRKAVAWSQEQRRGDTWVV